MARKNFVDRFDEVAKISETRILEYMVVADNDLVDYPENNEDVSYTEDLEISMKENGFTDPIEITDYNMPRGKWMILSGHRRRVAGKKVGYKEYPAIIKHFSNKSEFKNYILMSNSYRNAENDPFLYTKRYKMHEEYLKEINFSGDKATEIGKRMGMSRATALRYNQMNKVIIPVWDLVRNRQVGMSNVLFMSAYELDEQEEIYDMMMKCIEAGEKLNEEMCKHIKDRYDNKKSGIDTEQIPGQININKLDEGAYLPDAEYHPEQENISEPDITPEPATKVISNVVDRPVKEEKKSTEPVQNVKEETFFHYLNKVDEYLTSDYRVSSKENAVRMMTSLKNMIIESIEEIKSISKKYDLEKMLDNDLKDISCILDDKNK